MTILTDLDAAIEAAPKRPARLVMGEPSLAELARQRFETSPTYRGIPIMPTTDFQGWELET